MAGTAVDLQTGTPQRALMLHRLKQHHNTGAPLQQRDGQLVFFGAVFLASLLCLVMLLVYAILSLGN